jgi:hypothetical protein
VRSRDSGRMPFATDRIVSAVLGAGLLAAIVVALTAHPGVLAPSTPTLALPVVPLGRGAMFASVDLLEYEGHGVPVDANPIRLPAHAPIHIIGWAVDPRTGAPPSVIEVRADDGAVVRGNPGIDRPDVAHALNRPAAIHAGFSVPADSGAPGRHVLRMTMVTGDGRRIELPKAIVVDAAS